MKTITLNNGRKKGLSWYEDEAINLKSKEGDDAFDSGDSKLLLRLMEECRILAENKSLHKMIKTKYYYDGFTCLSNRLETERTPGKERKEIIEKCSLFIYGGYHNEPIRYF